MDKKHPRRIELTRQFFGKATLDDFDPDQEKLGSSRQGAVVLCCQRLPVLMVRNHNHVRDLKAATTFMEQGHLRIGPYVVDDPAYLVTRGMEDFVSWKQWKDISKTKK
ncbi:hypothetical protein EGW08_017114 [Elysia chlorotica]|uniref:RNA-binding S4 domain-containing protein n=1 Tax=Elysia chlorotica TaxID=188477 RepID=A0A433T0R4_ELYCH|nr:hypothetical protein EGW08_017114 [Elysia chlorotica]